MSPVWKLCRDGNIERLRAALASGQDINRSDEDFTTGLMWALIRGHNSVVELLLSQPSLDVNISDSDGATALHRACHGNVTGLRLLLADPRLTSINARGQYGDTPLMAAVFLGWVGWSGSW